MCGECANCELDIRTVTKGNNRLFELGKHLFKIRSKHKTNCGEDMNRCDCGRGRSLRGGKRNRCPFPVSVDFAPASTQGMPFVCQKVAFSRKRNRLRDELCRGLARTQPASGKESARGGTSAAGSQGRNLPQEKDRPGGEGSSTRAHKEGMAVLCTATALMRGKSSANEGGMNLLFVCVTSV